MNTFAKAAKAPTTFTLQITMQKKSTKTFQI